MKIEKITYWWEKNRLNLMVLAFLFMIVILATFLRFYHIGKLSFDNDEIATFTFTTYSIKEMLKTDPNMSLYNILARYWILVVPNRSEALLRSISALFSVVSIPVVFLLGRKLGTNQKYATVIGLISALLVSINAFHIQYAQEFRSYSLVFLLTSLSTLFLFNAIEKFNSPYYWVLYTITSVAAIYSHFFAAFIIVAQVVTLPILIYERRNFSFQFKRIVYSGISMALLVFPIVAIVYTKGAGQIAWITKPTFIDVKNFAIEIAGNQGLLLFSFYFLAVVIGLLVYFKVLFQKDVITKWKYTLVTSCLFLPVIISLVVSRMITPIFLDKYLLLIMPYTAVLAAIGIVSSVSLCWKKTTDDHISMVLLLIFILGKFVLLSVRGFETYFEHYQKEDWRGASQFLTDKCSTNLRLYYMTFIEPNAMYYNTDLKSQIWGWDNFLKTNPNSEQIVKFIPQKYNQVCLVLGHIITPERKSNASIIQTTLRKRFPKLIEVKSYAPIVIEVYSQ